MSGRAAGRRPSRASKYHQQYLSFLRKWKQYVHSSQFNECERLCLDHIDRIDRSIRFQIKQYAQRHGGAHLDYNDSRFSDIKNYRSKVRNLYAVLLHDYLKQHDDALEQYELCVEDDEFNASAHYNWAILYKNYYKDYNRAEEHYRKAIELKPNHAAYHNNYGLLLEQQLKRFDAAKKQFGIALSLDDKNGRAHTNMANLLKKHYNDFLTAKMHYEKAIHLDPQNPTRHFNYALFLKHNLHDYTAAANEYEAAIHLDNNYYQAHNEYKNFLLTESPFHRQPKQVNNNSTHSNHSNGTHGNGKPANMEEQRREHCNRCIKYAIALLWNKKTKDAKEIITMALKCCPNDALARLVQDPYGQDAQQQQALFDSASQPAQQQQQQEQQQQEQQQGQQLIEYQQMVTQKEHELYHLHNKMDKFHRRLSNITTKLKQSNQQLGIANMGGLEQQNSGRTTTTATTTTSRYSKSSQVPRHLALLNDSQKTTQSNAPSDSAYTAEDEDDSHQIDDKEISRSGSSSMSTPKPHSAENKKVSMISNGGVGGMSKTRASKALPLTERYSIVSQDEEDERLLYLQQRGGGKRDSNTSQSVQSVQSYNSNMSLTPYMPTTPNMTPQPNASENTLHSKSAMHAAPPLPHNLYREGLLRETKQNQN